MRMGRWIGSLVVMAGILFLSVAAQGQDKDKKDKDDDKKVVAPPPPPPVVGGDAWVLKAFAKKDNKFYQTLDTKTTQTMKVMGQEVKQEQTQTFYIEWTVGEPKGDDWNVNQKIIGVKMDINIGGNKISYDSTDEKAPKNPMTDFFEALKAADLKLTINSKTLEVTKIEGADTLIDKLSSTNPQLQPLLKSILSNEALKQMAEPTWGAVPTKAVQKGSTWDKKYTLDLGGIGTYDTKYTYTVAADDKTTGTVDIKAELTYKAPGDRRNLPFTIKSQNTNLSGKTNDKEKNVAVFDKEKGRLESSTVSMILGGDLEIEISGQTTNVRLDQTQTSTVTTSDASPLTKVAPPAKK